MGCYEARHTIGTNSAFNLKSLKPTPRGDEQMKLLNVGGTLKSFCTSDNRSERGYYEIYGII